MHEFMPTLAKTIKRHTKYTLEEFGNIVLEEGKSLGYNKENKANLKFDQFVQNYIEHRTGEQISTITSTNSKRIKRIVSEWVSEAVSAGDTVPELSKFIEAEFVDLSPGQSERIARTEVALASNNGSLEAVKSLQIPGMHKEWVTARDARVRDGDKGGANHRAMNGIEIPIDEKFTVPPDTSMDGPGDTAAPADQVINCRCVLTYKSKNRGEI
jgi:uncharacterized protein with gpF-like domain